MLQVMGNAQIIWMKIVYQFFNPWILSAFGAAFLAAFCWMAAMTKLNLSYAYPFMSVSFILTIVLSGFIFHEPITLNKIIGAIFIVIGIIVATRTY
jgi:drug/metabolite transporter (DMT)-like permease